MDGDFQKNNAVVRLYGGCVLIRMCFRARRFLLLGFALSFYFIFVLCLIYSSSVDAQQTVSNLPTVHNDRKLYETSLEDLLQIPILSASLFNESSWTASSSVSQVKAFAWEQRGARRLVGRCH